MISRGCLLLLVQCALCGYDHTCLHMRVSGLAVYKRPHGYDSASWGKLNPPGRFSLLHTGKYSEKMICYTAKLYVLQCMCLQHAERCWRVLILVSASYHRIQTSERVYSGEDRSILHSSFPL